MILYHLLEASQFKKLKDNKVTLTDEERDEVMKADAVWHMGKNGAPSAAVWKSKKADGSFAYVTNTHRCFQVADSLKGAIQKFHNVVKDTA